MPPSEIVTTTGQQQSLMLPREEPTLLDVISAIVRDPSVDVARLEAVIGLKERMEARDAEKEFNRDFAAAMMEMPRVAKRGRKDMKEKGCIMYATYEDLDAAIRPIETKHGFARSFSTRANDKGPSSIMTLHLTHRAGHSRTSERLCRPDPGPGRNDIQAEGSGESYGRRYLTLGVWNIVTVGADDDGDTAEPITNAQALDIRTMLDYLAMTPTQAEKFWAWAEVPSKQPEQIQRCQWDKINRWLSDRVKAVEGGKRA
jgi:hypothetical protein